MPGVLKESIPGGYKKSISTTQGVITANVRNGRIYFDQDFETKILMSGILVTERNLDSILVHLYQEV